MSQPPPASWSPRSRAELAIATLVVIAALVVGLIVAVTRPRWETKTIDEVQGRADSTTLQVTVAHSECSHGDPAVRVSEVEDQIVLRAERNVHGDCSDISLTTTLAVMLDEPVGSRNISVEPVIASPVCSVEGRPNSACAP